MRDLIIKASNLINSRTGTWSVHIENGPAPCRCCIFAPANTAPRYAIFAGGAGFTSLHEWIADTHIDRDTGLGSLAVRFGPGLVDSYEAAAASIIADLESVGLHASWSGDPRETIMVEVTKGDRDDAALYLCSSCGLLDCCCCPICETQECICCDGCFELDCRCYD